MSQYDITQLLADGSTLGHGNFIVGRSKCINILLVGRSQTGKSTIVETLINPQKGTTSSNYRETRDLACNTLILSDKITNLSYQLNLIDTPGLKEMGQTGEISLSNDEILKLASFCIQENITSINIVCFVSRAGETQRLDSDVFRGVKNFLGHRLTKISMMVLTHCDEFPENKLDEFEHRIRSEDVSKPLFDFCKLGIVRFGAINKDKIKAEEGDPGTPFYQSTLKKVEKMRDSFLNGAIAYSDSAVKVSQLQRFHEFNEFIYEFKKEKNENPVINFCKLQ